MVQSSRIPGLNPTSGFLCLEISFKNSVLLNGIEMVKVTQLCFLLLIQKGLSHFTTKASVYL